MASETAAPGNEPPSQMKQGARTASSNRRTKGRTDFVAAQGRQGRNREVFRFALPTSVFRQFRSPCELPLCFHTPGSQGRRLLSERRRRKHGLLGSVVRPWKPEDGEVMTDCGAYRLQEGKWNGEVSLQGCRSEDFSPFPWSVRTEKQGGIPRRTEAVKVGQLFRSAQWRFGRLRFLLEQDKWDKPPPALRERKR